MILMIDNYDSFTFNLVQFLGELGQELVVKRNDEVTISDIENMKPDFLMISPGPCSPNEVGISMEVIKYFRWKDSDFWCLSRASIHCTSVWWRGCPCRPINAWKNVAYAS